MNDVCYIWNYNSSFVIHRMDVKELEIREDGSSHLGNLCKIRAKNQRKA